MHSAVELARQGHSVVLSDISSRELERAGTYAQTEGVTLSKIVCADALRIDEMVGDVFKIKGYNLVLCQGPLYHLLEEDERRKVLVNCARMTREGGFVVAAFVTKWAHLRDIARRDPGRIVRGEEETRFYEGYVAEGEMGGRYDRVQDRVGWHIQGGKEARELVESIGEGLKVKKIVACEGFLGGGLSEEVGRMGREVFERWVDICASVAEREETWGAADHLLVIAQVQ